MKNKNLLESFNCALAGIVQAIKQERNIKIHLIAVILVMILSKICSINSVEFAIVILTCIIVIVAELINTAIETVIDLYCGEEYNELAKKAKDVAAGAVFVTALGAVSIGYVIFFDKLNNIINSKDSILQIIPTNLVIVILVLVFIITITIKAIHGKNKSLLSGGMPSGHCALAFAGATAILLLENTTFLIPLLAYFLAFLVAQSRYEAKIHSLYEIMMGVIIGVVLTISIFKLLL